MEDFTRQKRVYQRDSTGRCPSVIFHLILIFGKIQICVSMQMIRAFITALGRKMYNSNLIL